MLLIMGLSDSGKTTFAEKVVKEFRSRQIEPLWLNADDVREEFDDWDFSDEGRIRQASRIRRLINASTFDYNIVDMIAPTEYTRTLLSPDYTVWMNTPNQCQFEDTNQMFVPPTRADLVLTQWGTLGDANKVVDMMTGEY